MSKDKEVEFSRVCIGFIPRDDFPALCCHYNLNGTCNFFLPKKFEDEAVCDDLCVKEENEYS